MKEYVTTEAERAYHRRYYQKNREKLLAYAKKYREEHLEERSEYLHKWGLTHDRSEYSRKYYQEHKEEYRQRYLKRKGKAV